MLSSRVFQRFSMTMIVTVFLCQVLGAFCPPMVGPVASAAQGALQHDHQRHAHSEHAMGKEMCPDSVVTPLKAFEIPFNHSLAEVINIALDACPAWSLSSAQVPASDEARHRPLYTLLSTLRI